MDFFNSYEDKTRAEAYAKLQFAGTYYLAFRDIPSLTSSYVTGTNALDFGCGTGRSTRFLQQIGFCTVGVDISPEMIAKAKELDPNGRYHCIADGDFHTLPDHSYDLILSAFTFDNIPQEKKPMLFAGLTTLLTDKGILINLVSSPEMYTHEWVTFTTRDFPGNAQAKSGDVVPIITKDFGDRRPCYDIFCTEKDYLRLYVQVGLLVLSTRKPLAHGDEPYPWVNETTIAPWTIYVLQKK